MGTGDLRHQESRHGRQHRKRKEDQRQRHPLQCPVLGHGFAPLPKVEGQAHRDQAAFHRLQDADQQPVAAHRQRDRPQFPPGKPLYRVGRPRPERRFPPGKAGHQQAGTGFADRVADEDCRTGVSGPPAGQQRKGHRRHQHPHRLLRQLRQDVRPHPPPGQEAPPQCPRHRQERQAGRQDPQPQFGAHVVQRPAGNDRGQGKLGQHRRRSQAGCRPHQPPQGLGHPPAAGQALGRQPGGRHIDAGGRKSDEHPVHRQDQLVQPHPLAAQIPRNVHAEGHSQQPQDKPARREQHRVFQIQLEPHGRAPSLPCQPMRRPGRVCGFTPALRPAPRTGRPPRWPAAVCGKRCRRVQ